MKTNDQLKNYSIKKIISLNVEHLESCLALDAIALNGMWSRAQWEKELSENQRICFGFFVNSHLLAFSSGWIVLDELHISAIAVHPHHRRKGLGKIILSKLLNEAKLKGAKKATLEVSSLNVSAKILYEKFKFKIAGKRTNYYKDNSDALILWLSIEDFNQN